MKHETYEFMAKDNLPLFYQIWHAENEKGLVCLIHGLGEHGGCYGTMAEYLAMKGYSLAALDLRGHGRSKGKRGHAASYELLMDDIDSFISRASAGYSNLPCFLYGHSMGGNLVLNYCLRHKTGLAGVIASGPWLRLVTEPPRYKYLLSRLLNALYPSLTMNNGLKSDTLYHSESKTEDYYKDPLFHSLISARLYTVIRASGLWALEHAGVLGLPSLVMHGSEDRVTSPGASTEFSKKAPGSTLKIWDGFYHVLQNEPRHDDVFRYVAEWIEAHVTTIQSSKYEV